VGEVCEDNMCVAAPECTEDADCAVGEVCVDNMCVAAPECTEDADCAEGEACVDNMCVAAPECTEDADCAAGEVCEDNMCVAAPECVTDGDCDDGNDCTVNSCVAGECASENAPDETTCFCSVCGAAGMCMSGECVVTPDPQTVRVQLTCPTTIGLEVNVGVEFTVSPDDQYRQGEATSTTVDFVATQQALPVSLPAQISEAEWSVAVGGASPTALDNTVIYDPPLEIDAGEDNELDGGSSTANVTPSASEVTYELGSIGIVVVVGGNPLPVTCDVPADGDQAVFPVDN
jgi:Cys-rich repeat protein